MIWAGGEAELQAGDFLSLRDLFHHNDFLQQISEQRLHDGGREAHLETFVNSGTKI